MYKTLVILDTRESQSPLVWEPVWRIERLGMTGFDAMQISARDVVIPNAVYPINEFNNMVYITDDNSTVVSGSMSSRTYTGEEFAAELEALLNELGTPTFTVVYDPATLKLDVNASADFSFVVGDNNVYDAAGFEPSLFTFSVNTASAYPVNLSGTKAVHLVSSLGGDSFRVGTGESVFEMVPMNVEFGGEVHYQFPYEFPIIVPESSLREVRFSLRDDNNNPYKLPSNQHWTITLIIQGKMAPRRARLPATHEPRY